VRTSLNVLLKFEDDIKATEPELQSLIGEAIG
jgi:hypothetical protein